MKKLLALLVVAVFATAASAGPIVTLVSQSDPATGLSAYVLNAEAAGGEDNVNAWSLAATVAHQVAPLSYGTPADVMLLDAPMADLPAAGWDAWKGYDSHTLFLATQFVTSGATLTEGNDGTDPASLGLVGQYGSAAKIGVGAAVQEGAALKPEAAGQSLDIYLWVVPSGVEATLSGEIASPGVAPTAFEFTVPEPATMSLLALGGVALLRRRR